MLLFRTSVSSVSLFKKEIEIKINTELKEGEITYVLDCLSTCLLLPFLYILIGLHNYFSKFQVTENSAPESLICSPAFS